MARATIKSGTINLLNTIIGAGILAMPYGLAQNGLVFGCGLILWSSLTSAFGLYLQNKVAKYANQRGTVSYFSLAQLTYPKLSILFDSAISIKCFGVGVSYLVVIGDLMPKIMETIGVNAEAASASGKMALVLMHRNFWITVFMVAIVAPLSYLKKLNSLRYTSFIALFSVAYLICLVVEKYFAFVITGEDPTIAGGIKSVALDGSLQGAIQGAAIQGSMNNATTFVSNTLSHISARSGIPHPGEDITWVGPIGIAKLLASMSLFVFAFTCHQNFFLILNELKPNEKDGSQTRQSNMIIRNSISTALASYFIVGIFGYLTFGSSVNANVISMYPKNSISSLVGRLCIVIMVSLSFPLQCHPCRGSVNHVIHFITHGVENNTLSTSSNKPNRYARNGSVHHGYTSLNSDIESIGSLNDSSLVDESFVLTTPMEGAHDTEGHDPIIVPLTSRKFYIITTCIVVMSYLVAISVTSLAKVLVFVGSTGSTSISFILPGLFGYMLIKPLGSTAAGGAAGGASNTSNGSNGSNTPLNERANAWNEQRRESNTLETVPTLPLGHSLQQLELTKLEKFCKYGGLILAIWGGLVMIICLSATIFLGATH